MMDFMVFLLQRDNNNFYGQLLVKKTNLKNLNWPYKKVSLKNFLG
jgi:hypothetical protein